MGEFFKMDEIMECLLASQEAMRAEVQATRTKMNARQEEMKATISTIQAKIEAKMEASNY
jgi:hypothetical protein